MVKYFTDKVSLVYTQTKPGDIKLLEAAIRMEKPKTSSSYALFRMVFSSVVVVVAVK